MSIRRIDVGPRMSQAVVHGKTVYLAGQVAADPKADVIGQTQQILGQIDRLLKEAGTDKTRILSARATTEARLAAPEYLVEIACIAALPD